MRIASVVATAFLVGCAGGVTLVNDKGEKRYCEKDSDPPRSNARPGDFNRCVSAALAAGFKLVDE